MRVLLTTYEGGGHVPPALIVGRRLQARGHAVRLVSDEATRRAADAAGLPFEPWRRAPNRTAGGRVDDPVRDWRARTPWGVVKAVSDAVISGPALAYAQDVADQLERFDADVVVSQELLFGAMAATEAARRKLVLLTGNLWCFPTREDVPPFGPGFPPARTGFTRGREQTTRTWLKRLYDVGLDDLNRARGALALPPLRHALDQLAAADLILLGTSAAFDFGDGPPPAPFHYAGPLFDLPEWTQPAPRVDSGGRPLVLVSFSTTFQDQAAVIGRCVAALARLPVQGVVTLGPAVDPGGIPAAANVTVLQNASHDDLVPRCAAMICHGGHGTLLRPLMHGVPVLCLPMGRDQPENAVRVVERGAGLSLSPRASPRRIAAALGRLLHEPGFASNARSLGARIAAEADNGQGAVEQIERVGAT